jgi:DNA-binding LacI/PurR family transcriptional regulator
LCNVGKDFGYAKKQVLNIINKDVCGIIFAPIDTKTSASYYKNNFELVKLFRKKSVPFVLFDRHLNSHYDKCNTVATDNFDATYKLTKHLINLGHKRIGYIHAWYNSAVAERISGYKSALSDFDIKPENELIKPTYIKLTVEETIEEYLNMAVPPTAIMVIDDYAAQVFISALIKRNVKIPDQMSFTGYDNLSDSTNIFPSLTTVEQPLELVGRTTAELLIEHIQKKDTPYRNIILKSRIIIRDSTQKRSDKKL